MKCDTKSTLDRDGRWRHECRFCGRVAYARHKEVAFQCKQPAATIHQLAPALYLHTCPRCNWQLETETNEPVEHVCGKKEVVRLGDRIESALESIGVTKEKYAGWKEALHLPPTCNCMGRQEWLNKLDAKVGLGEKINNFKSLMGW